jgi:disulfide bond formation protein DsbB
MINTVFIKKYILYIGFFQALAATLGSLIFSEIFHFPPCILCWYQRIAMYPLIVIFAVGILKKDRNFKYYAWPLIAAGWLLAFFHNLLYYNILPESAVPCVAGISCTTKFIEWFGFVTIPLLSLFAFTTLGAVVVIYQKVNSKK